MSISMIFVKVQNLVKATFFQVELLFTHNSYHFADYKLKPDKRNSNTLERKKFCFAPNPNSVSDTETDVFSEHQSAQDQYFALIYYRPQHSCGNVMILHLSIILSTGGGGGWGWRVCILACIGADTPLPGRRLLQRTVRILLECILVIGVIY